MNSQYLSQLRRVGVELPDGADFGPPKWSELSWDNMVAVLERALTRADMIDLLVDVMAECFDKIKSPDPRSLSAWYSVRSASQGGPDDADIHQAASESHREASENGRFIKGSWGEAWEERSQVAFAALQLHNYWWRRHMPYEQQRAIVGMVFKCSYAVLGGLPLAVVIRSSYPEPPPIESLFEIPSA